MLLNCGVGEDSWESLGLQGDPTSPSFRRSVLGVHQKDWYWSWNSNTLATWCEELTHLKRPQCWERLRAGGEGDNRGWDGWVASPIQWTWVWVNSGCWWWTGRPGMLLFMGSKRVGHEWATELNWTEQLTLSLSLTSKWRKRRSRKGYRRSTLKPPSGYPCGLYEVVHKVSLIRGQCVLFPWYSLQ